MEPNLTMWFLVLICISWVIYKLWHHQKERKLLIGLCCSAVHENPKLRQEMRVCVETHGRSKDDRVYVEGAGGEKMRSENQVLINLMAEILREIDRR